ncbi:hypothetical protein MAPG_00357 [Magnaporthiopsis poae ATCC 64411]|uniref:Uncharacterized protein n=1 Tax=Magnaporthiopsis poae (strain ATCC 64411 / 73-15) TaxID=644358 RepID=A0A0C4DKS7_MAGP6|nr:hypothetical protein MAPG_00357 [Magnaporthiopsis poae ATCC 64411]
MQTALVCIPLHRVTTDACRTGSLAATCKHSVCRLQNACRGGHWHMLKLVRCSGQICAIDCDGLGWLFRSLALFCGAADLQRAEAHNRGGRCDGGPGGSRIRLGNGDHELQVGPISAAVSHLSRGEK